MGIQDITKILCGLCSIPDQDQTHDQETTQSNSTKSRNTKANSPQCLRSPNLLYKNKVPRTHSFHRRSAISDISNFANSSPLIDLVPDVPLRRSARATPDISITEPTPRSSQDNSQSRSSAMCDDASQQAGPSDPQPNPPRYSSLHGLNTYVPFWDSVKREECRATRRAPAPVEGLSSRSRYRRRESVARARAREYAQSKSSESMVNLLPSQRGVSKNSADSGCPLTRRERVARGSTPVDVSKATRVDGVFAARNGTNDGAETRELMGHEKEKKRVVNDGGCDRL